MRMSIVVKIIGSSPGIIPIDDGLSFEDVCTQCCRDLDICPVSRNLFALRNETTKLYVNPSDLLKNDDSFELRLRFWPSLANLSRIGTKALNYFYRQVCEEFVEGKITAFNNKTNQSVALGLAITAMYCHMKDNGVKMSDVLTNYKKFVPKMVRRNSNLKYSTESLKTRLNQVVQNPPGETWFFKQQFLKTVAQTATDYSVEKYPVKVEEGDELVEFDLIIQPMSSENPGVKMQSIKKKILSQYVCSIEEICFVSIRKSDNRMEISRINGVPQYFLMESEESMKSCVGVLNGYYRLMEKWTFDLCGELVTPSLVKLRSLKCHGPVGDSFAYNKLRAKRQNKQGSYLLRESHVNYDELYLDVCLEDGQPSTTFSIIKSADGSWTFTGLDCQPCNSVRELLALQGNEKKLGIPGFELKECLPSSENDVSELLLCRQKPIELEIPLSQSAFPQLPVCIPIQSIQLYVVAGFQYDGRFTTVQRGVWRRTTDEQIQIVHKLLSPEYRQSHYQAFLESVQRSMFWRSETLVHVFGIVLDVNLRVIMEYFPQGPLDQYLREHDLPIIDLVEAATNLAKALFYLEEKGFVHGKVRCRNLMVASHSSNSIRVKLTDPGILLYSDDELPWIPIELYDSLELVHRRSTADIWACGTCMWEIFSYGEKPCSGFSKTKMIQGFLSGWRPPRPEKCLGEIYHIMIGTWYPDVSLRPKAQSVMRDINQILYEVYNSRRSNVYEQVNDHQLSLSGSLASGLTEATTLRALSENHDTISFNSQFDDHNLDTHASLNFLLSNMALNGGSSLQFDDEGTSELTAEIYELEMKKLELGTLLGQGFYGEVRMGVIRHSDGTEETVAVKKLKSVAMNHPESVDLQRECAIMKSLNHPNIVEIKAIVTEPSTMLVMEYVPMGCLLAYLRTEKEIVTDQQLIKYATDVAEGMAYLGENNIVHRDLAARNILVAAEDLVKISDFGLARQVGYNGYYVVRDYAQKLPMPWYAPESLAYWKFSVQSDVWSFGVTLYEMFSRGEEPNFVSGDHNLLLRALQQGRRLPCPPRCPPLIYRDLMRPCWDAEASHRPSFKVLLDKLRYVANQL
uniref:non-specific protein-tyrosine kinase n=1 Tax=Daphnia galeata TaxID=27404 RepID=A0A8J2S2Q1_9CRUS|nr:unnamed protein product [Daphnia galeata]